MEVHLDLNSPSSARARSLAFELLTARRAEPGSTVGPLTQVALTRVLTEIDKGDDDLLGLVLFWQAYLTSAVVGIAASAYEDSGVLTPLSADQIIQEIALILEQASEE